MQNSEELQSLALDNLAHGCAEETQKFFHQNPNDPRYCFEIFRRAYAEQLNDALVYVYSIYEPVLTRRARRHPLFSRSCQDDAFFARIALANFYQATHGHKFIEKFSELAAVLKYLYACLHSAIVQDVRANYALEEAELEQVPAPTLQDDASELWQHILQILHEPQYQHLAYQRFVLEMKPAEILRAAPEQWENEREITVALQLIRRRLRNDALLREMASFEK